MKRKITSVVILFSMTTIAASAQTSDAEAEAMANLLGVQKKEIIMKLVSVTVKDSVAFWNLYNEYIQKNNGLAKQRIQLYEETARSYNSMSPGVADSLAKRYFSNRDEQEKALEDYYKKIKSGTNSV